jgi:hypothetical protein
LARKRKKLKDLDYESKEYWDKLLKEEGLSMETGRNYKLSYVGGTDVLERMAEDKGRKLEFDKTEDEN